MWLFLLDSCDHAGIWKVNIRLAKFATGLNFPETVPDAFRDRIFASGSDYWFIPKFLTFQYGKSLNKGAAVKSAVREVVEMGFSEVALSVLGNCFIRVSKGLGRCSVTPTATATAKATAMATAKATAKDVMLRFRKPTPVEVKAYALSIGFRLDGEKFCAHYESNGWKVGRNPMKNWQAAVVTWKKSADHSAMIIAPKARPEDPSPEDLPTPEDLAAGKHAAGLIRDLAKQKAMPHV